MMYGGVNRSATQQIIVDLASKIYPDIEEEVVIDNFYVVDIFIPSEKLFLEV